MKQPADQKTLELPLEGGKRGRGRPAKPDALTPAERAKKYRDAKRMKKPEDIKSDHLSVRLIAVQKKLDLEHLAHVEAINKIKRLEDAAAKPAINPLAAEVAKLKRELKRRDDLHKQIVAEMRKEFSAVKSRK